MRRGCSMDDARDTDEARKPETQQQGSAPVAEPEPAAKAVTVHALEAAGYTLEPLDFATPELSQNHKLWSPTIRQDRLRSACPLGSTAGAASLGLRPEATLTLVGVL